MSERTSKQYPEPKIDGGTLFLPINISEITIAEHVLNDSGDVVSTVNINAYRFDEYRINRAEGLPEDASAALAEAFQLSVSALKILGVM